MNTKSSPSAYRYCIVRLSTVAVSTLVPALNVLSTTLPDSTFFSVVRTNAPPLPGLTCWNSTTVHSSPSRLRTRPFFRSLVVAISCLDLIAGVECIAGGQTCAVYRRPPRPTGRGSGARTGLGTRAGLGAAGDVGQGEPVAVHA